VGGRDESRSKREIEGKEKRREEKRKEKEGRKHEGHGSSNQKLNLT